MPQKNNPGAACMYVHASLDMYSDPHVLGLLLCAVVISLCCAVLVVLPYIPNDNIRVNTTAAVTGTVQRKDPKTQNGNKSFTNNGV